MSDLTMARDIAALVRDVILAERERCATIADHRAALARTLTATAGLALLEALPDAIRATPVSEREEG